VFEGIRYINCFPSLSRPKRLGDAAGQAMKAPLTVFICSTYGDLIEERVAVLEAIRALQQQHDSMEYFGAHSGQPIETCLSEVRRSNILVVIVGHLYGSLVPELGISFSEAEYSEAQRLGKQCLVYIRHKKVPVLPEYIEQNPEKIKLLESWKATLNERHTVYSFRDSRDLAIRVAADLSREITKWEKAEAAGGKQLVPPLVARDQNIFPAIGPFKPNLGRMVCMLCNRTHQVNSFWKFFQNKSAECPNRPQIYVIHGAKQEAHESFIQVLKEVRLKRYFESRRGLDKVAICARTVPWPDKGELDNRKQDLAMNLFGDEATEDIKDYSAATLCRLKCFGNHCLIIISHNLYVASWDEKNDELLLRWYIEDYWGSLAVDANTPQLLIFIKLQYEEKNKGWLGRWLGRMGDRNKAIIERLRYMQENLHTPCPFKVIEELTPIKDKDVRDWFSAHLPNIAARESELTWHIRSIFSEGEREVEFRSMATIEMCLENILKRYR
jgi:hypothetical protein